MKQFGMFSFLGLIFVSAGLLATELNNDHETQNSAEYQAWRYDMYRSLQNHDDINVRITVAGVLDDAYDLINNQVVDRHEIDEVTLLNLIQQGIKDPQASWQSLMIIRRLCQSDTYKESCDASFIDDRLISLRPHDFSSYLWLLNRAYQEEEEKTIVVTLERMSETSQASFLFQIDDPIRAAMAAYVMTHPIPDALPEMVDAAEKQQVNLEQLLLSMELMMLKLSGNHMLIGYEFRPLTELCNGDRLWLAACETIGDVLLHNSDSFIYQTIGQNLHNLVYSTQGRTEELDVLELQGKNRNQKIMCLSKVMEPAWEYTLTDIKYLDALTNSQHEGKTMEALAQLSYHYLLQTKPDQAVDPATCGLPYQKNTEEG
ncbi:hypothetical protein ACFODZ_03990 [Marinicella sediminis]|uniref:HEAT repeat domain-containing protein n=1 Tax=Marinicella sediminis TaxID=1792834 RepID=A0ABV7JBE5_9GAMM|nr:hypothetical protein [Marinicella sediminis]